MPKSRAWCGSSEWRQQLVQQLSRAECAKTEQDACAQVMEQLLRVVPDIKRIYVIIRSKRGLSGE